MEHWHGFLTARSIAQIHETTIVDVASDLSAHFVTVPARSLGGSSYLFQGSEGPLETLGLLRIADVPFGGVARSLAACLVSDDVETFVRKFNKASKKRPATPACDYPIRSCSQSTSRLPGSFHSSSLRSRPIPWAIS
jgi:hypothetical protein